jgi:hypothetical protein
MNNAKNMVFCVGNDAERELAFLDYAAFAGIPVRKLVGSYKGVTENSFEAPAKYAHDILPIIKGEESVLLLSGDIEDKPKASLFFPATLEEVPLGTLEEVTGDQAATLEAWTYVPQSGKFYTAH